VIALGSSYQITPHPTRIKLYITQQFRAKSKSGSMMLHFSDKKTMEAGTGHQELLMCLPCQYVVAASRTKETSLKHIKAAQDQSFPLFTRKSYSLLLHTNQFRVEFRPKQQ
jgi:hypothetical protein